MKITLHTTVNSCERIFRLSCWIASSAAYIRNYKHISVEHLNRTNPIQIAWVCSFLKCAKDSKVHFRSKIRDNYDDGLRQRVTHWKTNQQHPFTSGNANEQIACHRHPLSFSHRLRMRASNKPNCQQQFCVYPTQNAFGVYWICHSADYIHEFAKTTKFFGK